MIEYVFKLYGLEEKAITEKIAELSCGTSVDAEITADGLDIKAVFKPENPSSNEFDLFIKGFLTAFDGNIYALRDISLENQLVDVLKLNDYKISVAESFTGGNLAARIISVPGASSVFYEGMVTYDEDAKIRRLGVKPESLKKFKVVSSVVAEEMAVGLIERSKCDIAVSTTGLAGPSGDGSGLSIGLCYVGLACFGEVYSFKYNFSGSRGEIVEKGVRHALLKAVKCLTRQVNR